MNQLEKVREAVTAYDKAVKGKVAATMALKRAENSLHNAGRDLVRVLGHTVPGKAVIMEGRRYAVQDSGLDVSQCDDVVL